MHVGVCFSSIFMEERLHKCDCAWGHAKMAERRENRGKGGEKRRTWNCDCCDSWSDASISVIKKKSVSIFTSLFIHTNTHVPLTHCISGLCSLFSLQDCHPKTDESSHSRFGGRIIRRTWMPPKEKAFEEKNKSSGTLKRLKIKKRLRLKWDAQ